MNPVTHLFISWTVAATAAADRRDRALIAAAGVAPDLDGLGIIAEKLTAGSDHRLLWWSDYHHVLAHNLCFGLLFATACAAAAKRKFRTWVLAFVVFHLHLLGDIVGARGPDGDSWPIPYLSPISDAPRLFWSRQWALNAWPNFLITALALAAACYLAWKKGVSPLEWISERADRAFVASLRMRFGEPLP